MTGLGTRATGAAAGNVGLALAVLTAATSGTAGTFASALIGAGWSPGAAVLTRIAVAALIHPRRRGHGPPRRATPVPGAGRPAAAHRAAARAGPFAGARPLRGGSVTGAGQLEQRVQVPGSLHRGRAGQ